MNIAQIKQLQAVDGWVDFAGQIIEIKETKQRTKKNRLMQKVKIKDESDEIGAWIYADVQQCTPNQMIVANGMLKSYEDHKYIDYATVKNSQNTPQGSPQTPQNTPQSTKPQSNGRNTSIERQCAFKAACRRAQGTDMEPSAIVDLARQGQYFIETGSNINDTPNYDEQPAPPEDSDIPF